MTGVQTCALPISRGRATRPRCRRLWSRVMSLRDSGRRQVTRVLLKVRTETLPSELAQARIGPSSCGAHEMALTAVQGSWSQLAAL